MWFGLLVMYFGLMRVSMSVMLCVEHGRCPAAVYQLPRLCRGRRRPLQPDAGQDCPQAEGQIRIQALPQGRIQNRQRGQEPETLPTRRDEGQEGTGTYRHTHPPPHTYTSYLTHPFTHTSYPGSSSGSEFTESSDPEDGLNGKGRF